MCDPILFTLMNYNDNVVTSVHDNECVENVQDNLAIRNDSSADELSITFSSTEFSAVSIINDVLTQDNKRTTSIYTSSKNYSNSSYQTLSGALKRKVKGQRIRKIKITNIDVSRNNKRKYIKDKIICFKCCVVFPDVENLSKHHSEYHHLYDCFCCEICNYFKPSKISLMKHYMKHFQNDTVFRDFASVPDTIINCKICKEQFSSKVMLQYHMESNVCSGNSNLFFCHICKDTATDLAALEKHLLKHSPITCPICFMTFGNLQSYKAHTVQHAKGQVHYIGSSFLAAANPLLSSGYSESSLIKDGKERQHYSCEYCTKTFTRLLDLDRHKFLHNGIPPWVCPKCKETFLTSTKYKEHYITAHENTKQPFFCSVCDKRFSSAESLRAHERAHSGIKPFQCTVCGKGFTQRGNLKDHILTHSNERPWKCQQCSKAFKVKGDLTKHQIVHKGTKDFECSYCQKTFSRQSYLRRHLRIHTGEKPYVCDVCNKAFSRSENCQEHRRVHTGERPFVCHCGASFKDSGNFCNHKKIHNADPKKRKRLQKAKSGAFSAVSSLTTVKDDFEEISVTTSNPDNCRKSDDTLPTDPLTITGELPYVGPFMSESNSVDDVNTTQFVIQLENASELESYDKNFLCQTQIVTLSLDDPRMVEILRSIGTNSQNNTSQSHLTLLDQPNLNLVPVHCNLVSTPSSELLSG